MNWREASAAYESRQMGTWWHLPVWWREWIIATVENKTELHNISVVSSPPPDSKPKSKRRRKR